MKKRSYMQNNTIVDIAPGRSRQEMKNRLAEIDARLILIKKAIADELERPFFQRRQDVCLFLDVERKIYTALHEQLKWILNE